MSPVVPHAVFLAGLFVGGSRWIPERPVLSAFVHEATLEGETVRWDTRAFDCVMHGEPRHQTTILPLERTGTTVRLRPPVVQNEAVQVVLLRHPDLVFVPVDELSPHRTRHGFEVFRPDEASRDEVVRCLRDQGVHLPPTALIVGPKTPPLALEGRLVPPHEGAGAVLAVSAALLGAAVGGLAVAWRRLARRVRVEAAEAILRADLPDL